MTQNLNSQQKLAVLAPNKPLLIVAGAGTGKTKTLAFRLRHLLDSGAKADQICALTFTNKAAKEMAERVGIDLVGYGGPFMGTFHSLGARILRKEGGLLKRTLRFTIFDDHDSFQLIKKILKSHPGIKTKISPSDILGLISGIKSGTMRKNQLEMTDQNGTLLEIFDNYERELQKNNAFDFDDLIEKVVYIFKNHPEVLLRHQKNAEYLLVDEYQDVNNVQYELIRLLAEKSQHLSVVGDDQQTIYSWRGSNIDTFLNFERDWPESSVVLLEENYRSSANIISAAGALIAQNVKQKNKNLWTKNSPGSLIALAEAANEDQEADWVAGKIRNIKEKDKKESVAILYRTNAQSRSLEQSLLAQEIPYRIYGGLKFYERREIKDVVAALRYASNNKDEVSRDRLTKTFSKSTFSTLEKALLGSKDAEPVTLVNIFMGVTDYLGYVSRNLTNLEERRENIGELVYFATQFKDLPEMLERIALLQANESVRKNSGEEVQLMTIHLAKGLEFENVFIAGCSEGLLPHARSQSEKELEEERRLMYVAMTRARHNLFLSFYDIPSRFISEIPEELLRFESLISGETGPLDFALNKPFDDEEQYITLD